jgi:branched-chain amino acid transport system ATP-binding protein
MLLGVKELRVHYGKAEALKGISMEVTEGMIVALLGANGAGKTTTLRCISGLKVPTSGEICFKGNRIDGMSPQDIAKLGIIHVSEGKRLFGTMTVLENLELGAYLHRGKSEVARRLENVYEHFPILKDRCSQLAETLSGGEQQMLAMGRALMGSPRLLLMDEPSLGLSPLFVQEVSRIIQDINRSGVAIILVEQNARMALKLAQRAYILEVGNVSLQGDAESLRNDKRVKEAYLGG